MSLGVVVFLGVLKDEIGEGKEELLLKLSLVVVVVVVKGEKAGFVFLGVVVLGSSNTGGEGMRVFVFLGVASEACWLVSFSFPKIEKEGTE